MTNTLPGPASGADSTSPTDTLEPFEVSFPASHKIADTIEWNGHQLHVPKRRIHLSNDDAPVDVYDTSGPQGCDVREGVPKLRANWIASRSKDNDSGNFSQMHYAKRGVITEEMAFVACREGVEPEFVRSEIARGRAVLPRSEEHTSELQSLE